MADSRNPIKYSDLVQPDDSITKLIDQLSQLSEAYANTLADIKKQAQGLTNEMQKVSGATEEGRKATTKLASDTEKLVQEQRKLTEEEKRNAVELQRLKQAKKEQNDIAKLTAKLLNSEEGSYNRLSAQYSLNKIRLNGMSQEMRRNTEEGKKLETETRKIYEEMKRLQEATGKFQLNVGNYPITNLSGVIGGISTATKGMVSSLSTAVLGFSGVAMAGTAMAGAIVGGVNATKDFEKSLSTLKAITGGTEEDLKGLEEQARQLGATTIYTATEVVQLQTELAKLGYSTQDIENMTSSVLAFAQATGASLADASALVGASLRMFEKDTTHTQEFVDKMATATTKSALSFDYLNTALSTVSPVANAFGFNIEDVLALLGQLANAGFDASTSATATRNILLNLADANGDLAKSLGKPVTSLDELVAGLKQLEANGVDLATSLELTDKRSVSAFQTFLKGTDSVTALRDAMNDADGTAKEMAKTMGDNLEGDVKSLGSAWDDLMIEINGGQSILRAIIQWLVNLVRQATDTYKSIKNYVTDLYDQSVLFRALIEAFGLSFKQTFNVVGSLLKVFVLDLKTAGKMLHGIFTLNFTEIREAYTEGFKGIWGEVTGFIKDTAKEIGGSVDRMVNGSKKAVEEVKKVKKEATTTTGTATATATGGTITTSADAKRKKQAQKEAEQAQRKAEQAYKTNIQLVRKQQDAQVALIEDGYARQRKQTELNYNRQIEDLTHQLKTEKDLTAEGRKAISETIKLLMEKQWDEIARLDEQQVVKELQAQKEAIALRLRAVKEGSEQEYQLKLQQLEIDKRIAVEQNRLKAKGDQQSEQAIIEAYDAQRTGILEKYMQSQMKLFDLQQDFAQSEFDLLRNSEERKTRFRLQAEKERLQKVLELNRQAGGKLSELEVATIQNTIAKIDQEISKSKGKERGQDIYGLFGLNLDNEQKEAIDESVSYALGQLNNYMEAMANSANQAVENANKRVNSAQAVLDAEIEARKQGYASDVEGAQKELALAKKTQEKALKQQKDAQKAQSAIQTIQQIGDLVTASAKIWSQLGFPYAIPAIGVMWGSYALAKVKASQVARSTETYGDGTIELLQGGSHQSGNDIDLGTKPNGTRRRAEGGEFFAVINKRNSRRFRKEIPDVINSLNNGTFADKYLRAYAGADEALVLNMNGNGTDITELNENVRAMRTQSENGVMYDQHGNAYIRHKNLKQKIRYGSV